MWRRAEETLEKHLADLFDFRTSLNTDMLNIKHYWIHLEVYKVKVCRSGDSCGSLHGLEVNKFTTITIFNQQYFKTWTHETTETQLYKVTQL